MLASLLPRILGFLVIIITLALSPSIYSANADILAWADAVNNPPVLLADFIGLDVIAGFGAFIIIIGLLVSGGFFAVAGLKNRIQGAGMRDMLVVIGSVVIVIVMLTMFETVLQYFANLVAAAITASDSLGQIGFAILPIVLYVGIVAASGWAQVSTYRRVTGKSRRSARRAALAYV